MKTHVHLWQYLVEFFLEQEMLQIEVVERKSEHTFYVLWLFFRKSCRLFDNVKKYSGAREARDDNIIRRRYTTDNYDKNTNTYPQY